jgi:hypothetical protein
LLQLQANSVEVERVLEEEFEDVNDDYDDDDDVVMSDDNDEQHDDDIL